MDDATVSKRPGEGFSLVEMVVTLFLVSLILLAGLALLEFNTRVARVQMDVADAQQSVRVAQYDLLRTARMAGRGGLPLGAMPAGIAVEVANDVPADTFADPAELHPVLPGSDVLTVRGVIATAVYRISPGSFTVDTNAASPTYGTGSFQVSWEALPTVPLPQDLGAFAQAAANAVPEALVLTSTVDDTIYAVVELDPARTNVPPKPGTATIGFRFRDGAHTAEYLALSGGVWNPLLTDAAYAGIVEEHRFYVRDRLEGRRRPQLVRARLFPNTDVPHAGDPANWALEIADEIVELQVALGVDRDGDGQLVDAADDDDEWFFNHADDDVADIGANPLLYLRLNTIALTPRPDRNYRAPVLDGVEDHAYSTAEDDPVNGDAARQQRRRALTTLVDLRNFT